MKRTSLTILAGALLLCSAGVVLEHAAAATDPTLAEIAPYRQWTRLTKKPFKVDVSVSGGD